VKCLASAIEKTGNPFLEDSNELLTLDTKEVMPQSVVRTVLSAHMLGQSQYDTYVQERLVSCKKPITDTVTRNNLSLFGIVPKTCTRLKH